MTDRRLKDRSDWGVKWTVIVGALIALALVVTPGGGGVGEPALKLGFVDMTRLFNEYHRTQVLAAEFDAKWVKAQEELDRKADHIRELQKQRDETADALSEAEKAELEAEFRKAVSEAGVFREQKTKALRAEKQDLDKKLLGELRDAIKGYSTRQGYSMVFNESLLLHGAEPYDLTDEILRQVNKDL